MHNKGGKRHGRIETIFSVMPPSRRARSCLAFPGSESVGQRLRWSKSGGKCFPAAVLEATPTLLNLAQHQGLWEASLAEVSRGSGPMRSTGVSIKSFKSCKEVVKALNNTHKSYSNQNGPTGISRPWTTLFAISSYKQPRPPLNCFSIEPCR